MVKSKKSVPKKTEESVENDAPVENSTDPTGDEENDQTSQENGEMVSAKKKGKGKQTKKEDEDKEDAPIKENGAGDAKEKKKAPKRAAKEPAAEPARKSSRTPKPVKTTNDEEEAYEKFKEGHPQSGKKKRSASKSPAKSHKKAKPAKKEPEDYEVEEIVGLRMKNGKKEFKIRWKGYKPSDDSWEPEKHLSCQDLIAEYLESHKDEVEALQEKKTPAKKTSAKSKKGKKSKAK